MFSMNAILADDAAQINRPYCAVWPSSTVDAAATNATGTTAYLQVHGAYGNWFFQNTSSGCSTTTAGASSKKLDGYNPTVAAAPSGLAAGTSAHDAFYGEHHYQQTTALLQQSTSSVVGVVYPAYENISECGKEQQQG